MRRLAIIPARGGSKRIANKNIRDFCGKPMIGHILDAADKSGLFDAIHVSTEDPEIARVAGELRFAPEFSRPDNLADDVTPLMPVLKYVTEQYRERGQTFDQVWLLMACAPLIETSDLREVTDLFESHNGTHAVLSIEKYPVPIEWAYAREADGALTPVQPGKFAVRSQDMDEKYYDAGAFAVFSSAQVLDSDGAGDDTGYIGYVLPRHKAVDIDDEEDWLFAERLFRGIKGTQNPNG